MMVDSVTVDSASAESPCQRRTRRACTKGAVAQAQDSVHVRRGTKVTSEDDSKDQHLRNSFDILKRWRTGRWSKAPCNDHLFRLGGIQLEVIGGGPLLHSSQFLISCMSH